MFGYELKPMANNRIILFATPEKALLDLLYLYPFYNNDTGNGGITLRRRLSTRWFKQGFVDGLLWQVPK